MSIVNNISNEVEPWVLPVVIVLALLVLTCLVFIIVLFVRKPSKKTVEAANYQLEKEIEKYKKLRKEYKNKLSQDQELTANQKAEELKKIIDQELKEYRDDQLLKIDHDIQQNKNEILKKVILQTLQPMHLKVINETSVSYIPIQEEDKPFIIGKKGQNIKKLNEVTNCNISVERDSQFVEVSCPNPVDRTLAINTIKHLLKSQAFDQLAIENVYKKEKILLDKDCYKTGKEYLDRLNIKVPNDSIYSYIGRLKFRWSFSQNVLEHCYEVAIICEQLAKEVGLNPEVAKRVGFFHDIGKSIDYEKRYDHISSGIKIAKECQLPEDVIEGILKHHRSNCNDDYILLVRTADAWSAARTGARHVPVNDNEQTAKMIETKLSKIPNVLSLKAKIKNNTLMIIFVPNINDKKRYESIKYDIIHAIKKDVRFNKFKIQFVDEIM